MAWRGVSMGTEAVVEAEERRAWRERKEYVPFYAFLHVIGRVDVFRILREIGTQRHVVMSSTGPTTIPSRLLLLLLLPLLLLSLL